MPDFAKLPPEVKHIPEIVDLRITRAERRTADLEDRVTRLEREKIEHPHLHLGSTFLEKISAAAQKEVKTPFGNLPAGLAIFGAGLYAWKPEFVKGLLSVVWPG